MVEVVVDSNVKSKSGEELFRVDDDGLFVRGKKTENADDVVEALRGFLRGHGFVFKEDKEKNKETSQDD